MICVVNRVVDDRGIYVGRPSIFGNPFEIGKDGTRTEVIEKYEAYFIRRLEVDIVFKNEFLKLVDQARSGELVLACWCHPQRCHAEIIKKYIEIELNKDRMKRMFKV
jgi:hypothetical protein